MQTQNRRLSALILMGSILAIGIVFAIAGTMETSTMAAHYADIHPYVSTAAHSATETATAATNSAAPSTMQPLAAPDDTGGGDSVCSEGSVGKSSLPALRWSDVSLFSGQVTRGMTDFSGAIQGMTNWLSGTFFYFARLIWGLLFIILNFGLTFAPLCSAAEGINTAVATLGVWAVSGTIIVLVVVLWRNRKHFFAGNPTRGLMSIGGVLLILGGLFWVTDTSKNLEESDASAEQIMATTGSAPWIGSMALRATHTVTEGLMSQTPDMNEKAIGAGGNDKTLTAFSDTDPSKVDGSPFLCSTFNSYLYKKFHEEQEQRGPVAQGAAPAMEAMSRVWEVSLLKPWMNAQFGSPSGNTEWPSYMACKKLEGLVDQSPKDAATAWGEAYAESTGIGADQWKTAMKESGLAYVLTNRVLNEFEVNNGMFLLTECGKFDGGKWNLVEPAANFKKKDKIACEKPTAPFGDGTAGLVASDDPGAVIRDVLADDQKKDAASSLYSLESVEKITGDSGAAGPLRTAANNFVGSNSNARFGITAIALLTAGMYFKALAPAAIGLTLAGVALIVLLASLPLALFLWALGQEAGKRMLKATMAVAAISLLFSIMLFFIALITTLLSKIVVGYLPSGDADSFWNQVIMAVVPLIALFTMKKGMEKMGIADLGSISGSVGMPLAMAGQASGVKELNQLGQMQQRQAGFIGRTASHAAGNLAARAIGKKLGFGDQNGTGAAQNGKDKNNPLKNALLGKTNSETGKREGGLVGRVKNSTAVQGAKDLAVGTGMLAAAGTRAIGGDRVDKAMGAIGNKTKAAMSSVKGGTQRMLNGYKEMPLAQKRLAGFAGLAAAGAVPAMMAAAPVGIAAAGIGLVGAGLSGTSAAVPAVRGRLAKMNLLKMSEALPSDSEEMAKQNPEFSAGMTNGVLDQAGKKSKQIPQAMKTNPKDKKVAEAMLTAHMDSQFDLEPGESMHGFTNPVTQAMVMNEMAQKLNIGQSNILTSASGMAIVSPARMLENGAPDLGENADLAAFVPTAFVDIKRHRGESDDDFIARKVHYAAAAGGLSDDGRQVDWLAANGFDMSNKKVADRVTAWLDGAEDEELRRKLVIKPNVESNRGVETTVQVHRALAEPAREAQVQTVMQMEAISNEAVKCIEAPQKVALYERPKFNSEGKEILVDGKPEMETITIGSLTTQAARAARDNVQNYQSILEIASSGGDLNDPRVIQQINDHIKDAQAQEADLRAEAGKLVDAGILLDQSGLVVRSAVQAEEGADSVEVREYVDRRSAESIKKWADRNKMKDSIFDRLGDVKLDKAVAKLAARQEQTKEAERIFREAQKSFDSADNLTEEATREYEAALEKLGAKVREAEQRQQSSLEELQSRCNLMTNSMRNVGNFITGTAAQMENEAKKDHAEVDRYRDEISRKEQLFQSYATVDVTPGGSSQKLMETAGASAAVPSMRD